MKIPEIYSATGMMELIQQIGFLPLLDSGIEGFSAEDLYGREVCQCNRTPQESYQRIFEFSHNSLLTRYSFLIRKYLS